MTFSHDFGIESSRIDFGLKEDLFSSIMDERNSGAVGYYDLPALSIGLLERIEHLKVTNSLLRSEKIRDIAIIGIGGSTLGTKGIDTFLKGIYPPQKNLHFFENTDPIAISKTLNLLNKESTFFIVISKSGTTIETISIFKILIRHFNLQFEEGDRERIWVISDDGSPLSEFASHYGIEKFSIPKNVGGRFSVLSAVGIVPLTLAGYDTRALLESGGKFLSRFFDRKEDHLLDKACFFHHRRDDVKTNIIFAYADELEHLGKWYVQLWAESLGKRNDSGEHVGFTPVALTGSVDQHSFLQLIIEGPRDKAVTFWRIENFGNDLEIPDISLQYLESDDFVNTKGFGELINLQCEATMESLKINQIPTDLITFAKINEASTGTIIVYYELLTSLVGRLMCINPYDQPGVELGKRILYKKFTK